MGRYYPRGSGWNSNDKKTPQASADYSLEENGFAKWLYEDNWDADKLHQFEVYYATPGLRNYIDYLLDLRYDQEYMARYGLSYSDIHDPRKLRQTSSGAALVRSGVNFVSDMVKYLYR